MACIPVQFDLEGRRYKGIFSEVTGLSQWQLMVNHRYWGRMRLVNGDWYFDGTLNPDESLVYYFAAVIIAWYE